MTSEWIVRVVLATSVEISEASLDKMSDVADDCDATVALRDRGSGVVVTMTVDGLSNGERLLPTVIDWAVSVVCEGGGCEDATPVDVRFVTPEIYEAEALEPSIPDLASATDAAEILGVSRQRVHQLAASNSMFPRPVARVATGPLWTRNAIEWFDSVWERKAGRPSRLRAVDGPSQRTRTTMTAPMRATRGTAAATVHNLAARTGRFAPGGVAKPTAVRDAGSTGRNLSTRKRG
jgi:hypothetical protein